MEQSKGRRVILFPLPFQGHINPMLELANILHSKGFSIAILHTSFNSLSPSTRNPYFTYHSIPVDLTETEVSFKDFTVLLSILNAKCVEPFRECLSGLLSDDVNLENPIACLISDPLFNFTRSVAESFKLPRIVLRTGGAASFAVYAAFPLLKEKGYLPISDSRLEEPVTELSPIKLKDLPMMPNCDPEDFYQLITNMTNEPKSSHGLIFNTFEDLEGQALATIRQEYYPNIPIFSLGPFHKCGPTTSSSSTSLQSQDQTCISWLNTQAPKSVAYVSFGSAARIDHAQFLEIAWGLANSGQPFLWVVRPGLVQQSELHDQALPNGFLEALNERAHIVKWAPQKEVLAHPAIGAFWTHCGWNSTLESICEGVPMICTPYFSDQMVDARFVSDVWKVGLQLEHGIERGEVERTIRRLMVEKEGEEIKERALKLMEKANLSLKEGGSSFQSLDDLVNHILSL